MNSLDLRRYFKLLFLGFLVWLIPFLVAFVIFSLRTNARPFFETIMAVVVALVGVVFTAIGFRGVQSSFVKAGVELGLVFFAVSVLIDLPMFSYGPMATDLASYMMDVGLTYLIYPIITIGVGYMLAKR